MTKWFVILNDMKLYGQLIKKYERLSYTTLIICLHYKFIINSFNNVKKKANKNYIFRFEYEKKIFDGM